MVVVLSVDMETVCVQCLHVYSKYTNRSIYCTYIHVYVGYVDLDETVDRVFQVAVDCARFFAASADLRVSTNPSSGRPSAERRGTRRIPSGRRNNKAAAWCRQGCFETAQNQ